MFVVPPEEREIFEHKFDIYDALLDEIENYYKKDNLLTIVDGERPKEEVLDEIDRLLSEQVRLSENV